MQVFTNATNKQVPERLWGVLDLLLCGVWPNKVVDLFIVFFFGKEIGHLAGIEDVVDVFEETFICDLHISEDEGQRLAFSTRHLGDLLQVPSERLSIVIFDQLDLVSLAAHDEGGKFGKTLLAGAAHTDQHGIASGLTQDTADTQDLLHCIIEKDQI